MPLLPLEPFVHPDDLFADPPPSAPDAALWWVLHTKPRAEKCLARHLLQRSIPFFLPLYHRQWRNRGRQYCSYTPLFPGYVFLYDDESGRLGALESNCIVRCLKVADQDQLRADLVRVRQVMDTGFPLWPEERLAPGTRVEITSGALAGMQGKVVRRGKQLKFFVEVQFLQRAVSVEIERWMIEPMAQKTGAIST